MVQSSQPSSSYRELPWELRRRGLKDSLRHDQRVKDAIRKNLRELIAEPKASPISPSTPAPASAQAMTTKP